MRNNNNKNKRMRGNSKKQQSKIPMQIKQAALKYRDISFGSNSLLSSGNVLLLTQPSQGLGANNRIGDSIFIHHVDIVLNFHNEGATSNYMRFGLISFKGYFPGPSLSDILSPGPSGSIDVLSLYIPYYNTNFFNSHWDRLYTTCPNSNTDIVKYRGTKRIFKKVAYTPGTNSPVSNVLCFYALSDSAVIPSPDYQIQFRIWFSDAI